MKQYDIDVVIAVHSASRPIRRAVASVLDGVNAGVRAIVVAHNIDVGEIRDQLGVFADHTGVMLLDLVDGIHSPAGPMNRGLDAATAPYVALLGSDDEFAPGALDSWLGIARETGASTVLARIDRQSAGPDPLPPTRRGRTRDLDAVKDRLAYRSAPLGLISREHFGELRFTPGLGSGEDLEFTAALWFTGSHIAYDRAAPGYYVHEDGEDRVTSAGRSVAEDFAFVNAIMGSDWFPRLNRSQRRALGVKTLRIHLFDAILIRLHSAEGLVAHREALDAVIGQVEEFAPGTTALLSRVDRAIIAAMRAPEVDEAHILALLSARWGRSPDALLPRNPFIAFHRQAPYRTLRATVA
ncbi:glycosyltransferase [Microbacterium sp. SA39]|uniref:glycosyltransferase n=1 Tax=Microbacterium sp. SA39 TaxID=1263625 RepID=UPI0005FA5BE8|nr:glycosyltransferase [Microbacterium sp. SA39]KJQ53660.1 Glycosyl transferase family 2 [Microbacterium sp. SA39]